jgi:hypothetical protein
MPNQQALRDEQGIVVAEQPDAAEAGARILTAGGNAVDAAISDLAKDADQDAERTEPRSGRRANAPGTI